MSPSTENEEVLHVNDLIFQFNQFLSQDITHSPFRSLYFQAITQTYVNIFHDFVSH